MLETLDLNRSLEKSEYKKLKKSYENELFMLQRHIRGEKIPLMIVIEGLETAGKGSVIEKLVDPLDPRGFEVIPVFPSSEDDLSRPYLYRFWMNTPAKGSIHIFDRSWYIRLLYGRVFGDVKKKEWRQIANDIRNFERTLSDNGTYILKFWLHISQKQQKKRLKKLSKSPEERYRVGKQQLKENKKYDKFIELAEEMMLITGTSWAPWNLVSTENLRWGRIEVMKRIVESMESLVGNAFREKALEYLQSSIKKGADNA